MHNVFTKEIQNRVTANELILVESDYNLLKQLIINYGTKVQIIKHNNIANQNFQYNHRMHLQLGNLKLDIFKSTATCDKNFSGLVAYASNSSICKSLLLPGDTRYSALPQSVLNCTHLVTSHHLGYAGGIKKVNFPSLEEVYSSKKCKYPNDMDHVDKFNNNPLIKKYSTCHKIYQICGIPVSISPNNFEGLMGKSFKFTL